MKIWIPGYCHQTKNYERTLIALGAKPVTWLPDIFSPVHPDSIDFLPASLSSFDALLLPGGGDIHPGFFGQENHGSNPSDLFLDQIQLAAFQAFYDAKKPILGICRGMQLINVALGGTLIQDLPGPAKSTHAYDHSSQKDRIHESAILPDTFLHTLYGTSLSVNSAHHQATHQLGRGLQPAQYGPGQVLEALYHNTLPILGLQWHPERLPSGHLPFTPEIFRYFLDLIKS